MIANVSQIESDIWSAEFKVQTKKSHIKTKNFSSNISNTEAFSFWLINNIHLILDYSHCQMMSKSFFIFGFVSFLCLHFNMWAQWFENPSNDQWVHNLVGLGVDRGWLTISYLIPFFRRSFGLFKANDTTSQAKPKQIFPSILKFHIFPQLGKKGNCFVLKDAADL